MLSDVFSGWLVATVQTRDRARILHEDHENDELIVNESRVLTSSVVANTM